MLKPVYDYQRRLQEEAAPGIQAAAERRKCAEQRVETLRKKAGREDNRTEREALVDEAAQLATELPSVPPRPALVVSDRTPEKLEVDLAEQDGALLMASEEAGSLFEIAGGRYSRDGGAQLDTYLKAYDGGEIDTARIGRAQVVCDRPALSIIVTPQPLLVQQLRERPEFHHRGLLPRFLWAFPATRVGRRPYDATVRENIHVRQAYAQLVGRLLDWRRQHTGDTPMRLCIVGEALDIWAGYANRVEEELREGGRLHAIREWGSKQAGRVARIAGGLHVADTIGCGKAWQENISTATLRAACRLGEYSEAHALATYDEMRADPRVEGARKVLAWITRTKKTQFTAREAFRGVHSERFHAMADLDPCLGLLIEFGYLRLVAPRKAPGRGRPVSPRYVVNPALHRKSVTEVTITRGPAGNGRDPSEDDDDPGEDREPISA